MIRGRGIVASVMVVLFAAGCSSGLPGEAGPEQSGSAAPQGRAVSPLENPDGTEPGLAPVTSDGDTAEARDLIEGLTTKGRGPKTGYERDEFGYAWMDTADGVPLARNGCDTRIISMVRAVVGLFSQRMQGVVGCA